MRTTHRRLAPAGAALLLLALVGCSAGPVRVEGVPTVDDPDLSADDRAACEDLVADLPATVAGEEEREITPEGVLARGWGEPAIVVLCGATMPASFSEISDCEEVGGVGWYAPPAAYRDQTADAVITTIGFEPIVQIRLPAEHRPPVEAMVDIAPAVLANATLVDPCV
ncbi:DUF3515 family protein [Nocardioides alkalitolerans]|uniref:DUF3515 family protein n=1 Tax=Nocardioides alkalitolerans TaxID=281714 RepID=UPI0003F6B699|nr:DUF3515 family protein [Nocardioides alkalitolerans]